MSFIPIYSLFPENKGSRFFKKVYKVHKKYRRRFAYGNLISMYYESFPGTFLYPYEIAKELGKWIDCYTHGLIRSTSDFKFFAKECLVIANTISLLDYYRYSLPKEKFYEYCKQTLFESIDYNSKSCSSRLDRFCKFIHYKYFAYDDPIDSIEFYGNQPFYCPSFVPCSIELEPIF